MKKFMFVLLALVPGLSQAGMCTVEKGLAGPDLVVSCYGKEVKNIQTKQNGPEPKLVQAEVSRLIDEERYKLINCDNNGNRCYLTRDF